MELDPNAIYKAKFRELTELLGRVPTTRDSGWLQLQDEYKKAWMPAEETVLAPTAREAVTEPLSGPGITQNGVPAVSEPDTAEIKPGAAEAAIEGDRGPSGGIMARCVGCGQLWERPARRGRPAIKCE